MKSNLSRIFSHDPNWKDGVDLSALILPISIGRRPPRSRRPGSTTAPPIENFQKARNGSIFDLRSRMNNGARIKNDAFLLARDNGFVLNKIGVKTLDGKYRPNVVRISLEEFIEELLKPENLVILTHTSPRDGIWISKMDEEFELIAQGRGQSSPFNSHLLHITA